MMKVFIDPGHGGNDSGAVGPSGVLEKNLTIEMAELLSLACRREGWDVRWSRTLDLNVEEWKSADKANAWNADVYVALHANGASNPAAKGHEVLYWHTSTVGKDLAESVIERFSSAIPGGHPGRGAKPKRPGDRGATVLSRTKMPAIIVEPGFVTNVSEELWLQKLTTQAWVAQSIVEAIRECFFERRA